MGGATETEVETVASRELRDLVGRSIDQIDQFTAGLMTTGQIAVVLATQLEALVAAEAPAAWVVEMRTLQSELEYASAVSQETHDIERRKVESAAARTAVDEMRAVMSAFVATFVCPVCGYPGLTEEPWTIGPEHDSPSYEICPSCGTEFGYTDFRPGRAERRERQRELRSTWIAAGRPWDDLSSYPTPSELGWEPSAESI
jgi:hypothetical protein